MRVACVGYRDWALDIYDELSKSTDHTFLIFRSKAQYDESALKDFKPDIILFYGWSWIISSEIINECMCIMLHPSPLPYYRGGSPIQNQIIAGENNSAVTLFVMDDGIDTGPIIAQTPLNLGGSINDIFKRITSIGINQTLKLLEKKINPIQQDNDKATYFPRRTPDQSEITIDEIQNKSSSYLYNKIRMLQSPYPNAFIKTSDGKKLLIIEAIIDG